MKLSDIQGQDRAISFLRKLLAGRRLPPALLFHGPEGVGKAVAAEAFARALACPAAGEDACGACAACAAAQRGLSGDLQRLDAAYQAGLRGEEEAKQRSLRIDTVRHAIRALEMRSLEGRFKTAVVPDAHLLVPEAANAMLKALEEPPPATLWILATHRPNDLLPTIRSRCQPVAFSPLPEALVAELLALRGVPREAAAAARGRGSLGRALALAESPLPDPSSWIADPLAPMRMAEALPRELHRSRPLAGEALEAMAWHARRLGGGPGLPPALRSLLAQLEGLRRALASNADPRLVVELGALKLQAFCR